MAAKLNASVNESSPYIRIIISVGMGSSPDKVGMLCLVKDLRG